MKLFSSNHDLGWRTARITACQILYLLTKYGIGIMQNGLDVFSDGQTTLLGILPMILTPVQSFKARTGYAPYSIKVYE